MNLNASIIDQRLLGLQEQLKERAALELNIHDVDRLKSLSFLYLCVQTVLDLDIDETFDCLTEGSGDFGVDAIHIADPIDNEFSVTLFQSKYKHKKLDGNAHFEENGIQALVNAIQHLFNPNAELGTINDRLHAQVEEIRSLMRNDGHIPQIRAIACSNGIRWNDNAQSAIDRAGFGKQVTWEYINHDTLINLQQRTRPVEAQLRLTGKAIIEDMNFSRICVGRMLVAEIHELMKTYGDRLLERNIRRYLGLHGNRVNEGIQKTLQTDPDDFYFFNNGVTLVCSDFNYNALSSNNYTVHVKNLQIVNGGQTCMTIYRTLDALRSAPADASVLVRIYELPTNSEDLMLQITHATNSQNPVELKDLKANDEKQKQLKLDIEGLGYKYHSKRAHDVTPGPNDITSGVAAEALLAVWRKVPHRAKFFSREHFGKLYGEIFTPDLNGAQTILAVLLYRIAENRRRAPLETDPLLIRYASCFIAMQMGKHLLKGAGVVDLSQVTHQNFNVLKTLIEAKGNDYFNEGMNDIEAAVQSLYGKSAENLPIQQLSATFRRGDLIDFLKN
jgi:hypothetical protein